MWDVTCFCLKKMNILKQIKDLESQKRERKRSQKQGEKYVLITETNEFEKRKQRNSKLIFFIGDG